jgi:hypothetical protein
MRALLFTNNKEPSYPAGSVQPIYAFQALMPYEARQVLDDRSSEVSFGQANCRIGHSIKRIEHIGNYLGYGSNRVL